MLWIRSFIFTVCFYSAFVGLLIICMPALILGKKACRWVFKILGDITMYLCRVILGITYEVRGLDKLPKEQALYACKHQSVWEAGALLKHLPHHTSILKKELMYIPLYGQYLVRSGMIGVDRKQGVKALPRLVDDVKKAYDKGDELFMFPEGTRTMAGERGEYKRGILFLYEKLNVPVVPIALNSGLVWPRRQFIKKPGHVVLEFLDPIPPGLPRKEFMDRLENAIETASLRLYHDTMRGRQDCVKP